MYDRFLIVADDFTGANDTGVQLSRRGFETEVVFSGKSGSGSRCLVIDTESRSLTPEDASRCVGRALEAIDAAAFGCVIKKVDSTLRGNIAAEIGAMDRALRPELIIFAPALPDLGRTTVNGTHLLGGVRITQTELARDPKKPVLEDDVTAILREACDAAAHISLSEIRGGRIDLSSARAFASDAETNEDMRAVIRAAIGTGRRVLWVGTAAIADNIMELERKTLPAFAVAASMSDVTAGQVKAAAQSGAAVVSVPFHELLSGEANPAVYIRAAEDSLRAGRDTILASSGVLDRADLDRAVSLGAEHGMSPAQVSEFVQRSIGVMAAQVLVSVPVSGAFFTGGDTAIGVLNALGADGSRILTEISVGIPMMRLVGGKADGLKVITKAGAFGAPDAVKFALRKLREA